MISIVDYGLGNVKAFLNVYKRLNIDAQAVTTGDSLRGATKLILPGVGHFDHAMERLDASGMREPLDALVIGDRVPVLGICVGMQMLAGSSDEGARAGLGWIDGRVRAFEGWSPAARLPMPHMGWNDVTPRMSDPLLDGLDVDSRFYFLHSFFFECSRPESVVAVTNYGADFACVVRRENIYGAQFHPEKSHHFGTRLLKNFAEL